MKMPKIPKFMMLLLALFTILVIGMFFKNTTSLREGMETNDDESTAVKDLIEQKKIANETIDKEIAKARETEKKDASAKKTKERAAESETKPREEGFRIRRR